MDRRKFISGAAGTLLTAPLVALGETPPKTTRRAIQAAGASLASLAANTARNLGSYGSGFPKGNGITAYSGIVYDKVANRMLLHGGGHADSNDNGIYAFDLSSLTWSAIVAATSITSQWMANVDTEYNRFIWQDYPTNTTPSGQPLAAHTYDTLVVVGRKLFQMQCQNYGGDPSMNDMGKCPQNGHSWSYDFSAATFTWSQYRNQTAGVGQIAPWNGTEIARHAWIRYRRRS